jgi:aryl-alcohol dehydrogenase-like predicted oxidoreductase
MEYTLLGKEGLEVSRLGLGTIPFGTAIDENTCRNILDSYHDLGGNLIDTSNFYGGGKRGTNSKMAGTAERMVGKLIHGRRDRFVVATKGYWLMEDEVHPNSVGLSRTYLAKNIENSLQRLGADYIDLYQCHNRDLYTPVEETMSVLDDFISAGKIRYIGVSNWDGWHVTKANSTARYHGMNHLVSNQIWYNLADRSAEHSIIPACRDENVSIIGFGAMAQGFLSGKYTRHGEKSERAKNLPPDLDSASFSWKNLAIDRNWNVLDILKRIAEEHDRPVPPVVLRWLLDSGNCDVALLGASNRDQFEQNMQVMDFVLPDNELRGLNDASKPPEPYPVNFHNLFCRRDGEHYGGLC